AAALPAILYYAGIMATVHWEALKHGIGTMKADIPPMSSLARRALLFTPFFTIVYFLHAGYSPSKAALYSMLTAIVVSWVAGESPMTPRKIFETCGEAMRSGVIIASVLAASAQIAGANPMTAGWHATRIGIGGFLAPFLFAFQPPLLGKGTYPEIAIAFVSALVGISALSAAVAGHMFGPLTWPRTIFLVVVSL